MKNLVGVVALGIIILAGCDRPTEPLSATRPLQQSLALKEGVTKEHIWYVDDYVFFSICAQELIQLGGREQVVVTTTVEEGKTTYRVHGNTARLTGVGLTSGAQYVFALTSHSLETYYSDPPFAFEGRQWGSGQVTAVKGEGQWTRIQIITSYSFDGT